MRIVMGVVDGRRYLSKQEDGGREEIKGEGFKDCCDCFLALVYK